MAPSATSTTASTSDSVHKSDSSNNANNAAASTSAQRGSDRPAYLQSLSASQYAAATHSPTSCLQILAGPGSGKTRVLTSRVAWLILDPANQLKPEDILVVTFTNKAANEMKMRLVKLIGKERVDNLVIGTFHSVCARYLRKYGRLISLPNNFTIIDSDDAKRMFKAILKELKPDIDKEHLSIKPEQAMSEISKAKAKEIDPVRYRQLAEQEAAKGDSRRAAIGRKLLGSAPFKQIIATIYFMYQQQLVDANALDFDDLLVYGVQLFRQQNQVARNIRHVLVDEFQDTNITQYELMRLVATASQAVSIVGDPDQSIYGWRSAEIGNLDKMTKEFKGTQQARLEENYRSTGAILELALKVVQQDTARVDKDLFTSHPRGLPVVLKCHGSAQLEGAYIASEVKRLIAHSGGMLDFNDFVILLRFNYLSRAIEAELQARGIDSRMMGGHKFFDRMEVKDLLAYLALADNPGFTPAFIRVVNVPKRGIGEKSVTDLLNMAKQEGCKPMELVERVVQGGKNPGIKPAMKKGLKDLVEAVEAVRQAARAGTPVAQLIETLIEKINYENYLKAQPDYEARWGNVQELISFSTIVAQNTAYADGNAPSIPVEEILSHTLSNQEGADTGKKARYESDGEDDEFEEVDIKPARPTDPHKPSTHPFFNKHGAAKRRPQPLPLVKGEVIDLCDSSEENQEAVRQAESKPGPSKKRRTTKAETAFDEEASADEDGNEPKSILLSKLDEVEDRVAHMEEDEGEGDGGEENKTPLRVFLEASILATDMDAESDDKDEKKKPKVTLSTCHAAKGLEWPVVFIPAIEEGCFPSFRCERPDEIAEERRLLYVAMTRAECMLYLTHATARMQGGDTQDKMLSNFVASIASKQDGGSCDAKKAIKFCTSRPEVDTDAVKTMAGVTGKALPSDAKIKEAITGWEKKSGKEVQQVDQMNSGRITGFGTYSSYGGAGGYTSAGVHSGATGGWNSQMGFGLYSDDGLRSASNAGRQGAGQNSGEVKKRLGFVPPSLGSFSSAVDGDASPPLAYSGFQRASSLGGGGDPSRAGGNVIGAFSNRSEAPTPFGAGGRRKQPLVPPSRQPAATPPAPPSFTDAVRLRARPEDSVALAREDGTAPRPRADLNSFQQAHSQGISSILNMLPANSGPTAGGPGGGSRNSPIVIGSGGDTNGSDGSSSGRGSSNGSQNKGKRRLGMMRRF